MTSPKSAQPEILAPAGNKDMFLAALAAGADSIYCGLKHFSARMEADNFSIPELAALRELAAERGTKTYCAFNTLIKPNELQAAGRLLERLIRQVRPQALIFQDLSVLKMVQELGFQGELHLSTLANPGTLRSGLEQIASLHIKRAVLPRELSLEEVQLLAESCPQNLDLEVFVHGALCYAVSGRCYWSSWLGGKSSLRGRCVQPCRRLYRAGSETKRFFSCLDLSLDILVKTLLDIPAVNAWKIEGRKKGPHSVFYITTAYRLLRDHPTDSQAKKQALDLLKQSLGRKPTHSIFLPQRPHTPIQPDQDTGSGLFISKLGINPKNKLLYIRPRQDLLPGDLLRIGYQDLPGHQIIKIKKFVAKGSRYQLPGPNKELAPGTAAFLIDRREPELKNLLTRLQQEFSALPVRPSAASAYQVHFGPPAPRLKIKRIVRVFPDIPTGKLTQGDGLWLTPARIRQLSRTLYAKLWFWLPPIIWPKEESSWIKLLKGLISKGATGFVCNSPWQIRLFSNPGQLNCWAGPFCNISNPYAVSIFKDMGFSGAFAIPELNREHLLSLPKMSALPLGLVLAGAWPLCISRFLAQDLQPGQVISSPKQELSWVLKQGQNYLHYPNWELDLSTHHSELEQAGYSVFAQLIGKRPPKAPKPQRTSTFNWDLRLL